MKDTGPLATTAGAQDDIVFRPQVAEREPRTTTALVDDGSVLYCIEDGFKGVIYRQDEACSQLAEITSGVHQGRRVGEKFQGREHLIKIFGST
jgi:hypothetical protein